MRKFPQTTEIIFSDQIADSAPPIEQKTFRLGGRRYDPSEKCWNPPPQTITIGIEKVFFHLWRPGLTEAFPAVDQHAGHVTLEDSIIESANVTVEASFYSGWIELVAFPTCRLLGSGSVHALCVHVSDTNNSPPALRNNPIGFSGQIYHFRQINP